MNIAEVKSFLGVASLDFKNVLDKEEQATPWYKAWAKKGTVVVLHEDLRANINTSQKLSLKNNGEKKDKNGESYQTYIIVEYNDVAFSV